MVFGFDDTVRGGAFAGDVAGRMRVVSRGGVVLRRQGWRG